MKRPPLAGAVLQSSILSVARLTGWHVAHFRAAMTEKGWRTPVAADGKGYPDLHLVRERSIFAEIKGDGDRLRPEQEAWLEWLRGAGHEVYVWTPEQWFSGEVERVLNHRDSTSAVVAFIEQHFTSEPPAPVATEGLLRTVRDLLADARTVEGILGETFDFGGPEGTAALRATGIVDLVHGLADLERDVNTDLLAAEVGRERKPSAGGALCAPASTAAAAVVKPAGEPVSGEESEVDPASGPSLVSAPGGSADTSPEADIPFEEPTPAQRARARFRGYLEGTGWKPIADADSLEQAAKLAPWATAVSRIHQPQPARKAS